MSGRDVLEYLKQHLNEWVSNKKLREASGIDDVPRQVRSLRQEGWGIETRRDGHNRLVSAVQGPARGTRLPVSSKDRFLALHKSGHRCRGCGRGPTDGIKLVVDHIVPVNWGGDSHQDNLQALCEECNHGKQAWVASTPAEAMRSVFAQSTVEARIEALFDQMPDQNVPSLLIQLVSGNALDWQRALRRIRQRTGKRIVPVNKLTAYRHVLPHQSHGAGSSTLIPSREEGTD